MRMLSGDAGCQQQVTTRIALLALLACICHPTLASINVPSPAVERCPYYPSSLASCRPLYYNDVREEVAERRVAKLDLSDTDVDDEILLMLAGLISGPFTVPFNSLKLVHACRVAKRGVEAIKKLGILVDLDYSYLGCNDTDAWVSSDALADALSGLPNLRSLSFRGDGFSPTLSNGTSLLAVIADNCRVAINCIWQTKAVNQFGLHKRAVNIGE